MTWPIDPVDHADDYMASQTDDEALDPPPPLDPFEKEDAEFWRDFAWDIAMERDADLPDLADETTTRDEEGDD